MSGQTPMEHVRKQFEEADGATHKRTEKLGIWASRWGETILNDLEQHRAVQAAINGLDPSELREVARMLRARAHNIDTRNADPETTLAAVAAESQSEDVMVAVGRLLGRAATYQDCYGDIE